VKWPLAAAAAMTLVLAAGCDSGDDRRSGCKPSPKAMSQVLVKPGPGGGGGRPAGGGGKGGGAKPVKPKAPKNGTNGGVPVGCR
jgi:hypothetical protein